MSNLNPVSKRKRLSVPKVKKDQLIKDLKSVVAQACVTRRKMLREEFKAVIEDDQFWLDLDDLTHALETVEAITGGLYFI